MSGLSFRLRLLCAVCLAGSFFALFGQPGATAPKPLPIQYTMLVDVDYDKSFLNVTQVVKVPNRSDSPMTSLVFNVPPAAFGAFTLSSASVDGSLVTAQQDNVLLEIPFPQPLAQGDTAVVTLRWGGALPDYDGRYGKGDGVLILGNWYPMLSVMQDGVWERHQYTVIGDAFFTEVADYDVTVNVPANVTVAASGGLVSHNGGKWVFRSQNARDFALGISSRFQTQTRKVDSVTMTAYYLPGQADAAKTSLDVAEQAMRWYNQKIGPYPFQTLAIVQGPGSQVTAQEHAGLFTINSSVFTPASVSIYSAHELAHAWFFGAVGNDQIRQPWMDEGLVNSVSLNFLKEKYPDAFANVWGAWGGTAQEFKNTESMNRGIYDFDNESVYFYTVYRQGAAFFTAVREAMGDDAYWKALHTYYTDFTNQIAQPQDLLRTLRQGAGATDLMPVFREFLDYSYLKYADLAVDIGVADGQTWDGLVSVPITVTADSPTYTLAVLLDGSTMTTTNRPVTITVDTVPMTDGVHILRAVADDIGVNHSDAQRTFHVQKPTPTPPPTAIHSATSTTSITATAPAATRVASPQATPTEPPPPPASDSHLPWSAFVIGAVVVFAAAVTVLRMRKQ